MAALAVMSEPVQAAQGLDCITSQLSDDQWGRIGAVINAQQPVPEDIAPLFRQCVVTHGWSRDAAQIAIRHMAFSAQARVLDRTTILPAALRQQISIEVAGWSEETLLSLSTRGTTPTRQAQEAIIRLVEASERQNGAAIGEQMAVLIGIRLAAINFARA